jgi:hypothetical protein
MSIATKNNVGQYVYAFVRSEDADALIANAPPGMGEASLDEVSACGITAITSPTSEIRLRPQRKYLAAHQNVVEWIATQWCMLPVSFGLIADGADSVKRLIERNAETLNDQLTRVDGRVEMNLTLRLTVANVFEYFADRHPELREASVRVAQGIASRDEQIEIGRQFEMRLGRRARGARRSGARGFERIRGRNRRTIATRRTRHAATRVPHPTQ